MKRRLGSKRRLLATLSGFCEVWMSSPSTSQVERALLRTLVERATQRAFHLSSHMIAAGAAGNKTSFATETSLASTNLTTNTFLIK
jgi:hypothetical protein